jgi:hypothetical protein
VWSWKSTPNGAQGHFFKLCMEALESGPRSGWTLHFYPWWWDPAYRKPLEPDEVLVLTDDELALVELHGLSLEQIKWRRGKQRELRHLFIQEYPEDARNCFLRGGFGYFGDLSGVYNAPLDPTFDEAHRYVAGLDFGQANDYTAMSVIDATAKAQVARLRINNLPWAEMRRQVIGLCKRWNVSLLLAEANSMGSTNIEAMLTELDAEKCSTGLQSFDTNNANKAAIIGNLHEALHLGGLKLQAAPIDDDGSGVYYDAQKHELGAFRATQLPSGVWRLAAPEGEHDDTVISLALSWEAVSNHRIYGGINI